MIEISNVYVVNLPDWGFEFLGALVERCDGDILKKDLSFDKELSDRFGIDRSTIYSRIEKLKSAGIIKIYPGRKRGKYIIPKEVRDWFSA